jgi:hypothetical protein
VFSQFSTRPSGIRQEFKDGCALSARLDYTATGSWDALNESAKIALESVGLKTKGLNIQVYLGISHALFEVTGALGRLFSTKKTIAIQAQASPRFNQLGNWLASEGYEILWLSPSQVSVPAGWLQSHGGDLLAYIGVIDHPITDLQTDDAALLAEAKSKKFYTIRVSHTELASQKAGVPQSTDLQVRSFSHGVAVCVGGERYKARPQFAEAIDYSAIDFMTLISTSNSICEPGAAQAVLSKVSCDSSFKSSDGNAGSSSQTAEQRVVGFEQRMLQAKSEFIPLSELRFGLMDSSKANRFYHRAALVCEKFDASAVIELLAEKLKIDLKSAGHEDRLEAASLLRWYDPRLDDWFAELGLAESQRRGLLFIDHSLLDSSIEKALKAVAAELSALQSS